MACSFWRWRQIWKAPFGRQKASSESCRHCLGLVSTLLGTSIDTARTSVDTAWDCVDTLSQSGNWVFWRLGLVSTLPGTSVDTA
ncbi:hypothetical protein Taro_023829 [Colocasia esculenta]|uniref:Uncharacterized protein n=1 Tax=Colocasia esculenta TaxID=4460 RepID=A0A843VIH2_COLES|nr:hypothetical protein [Colocasia esculenta]